MERTRRRLLTTGLVSAVLTTIAAPIFCTESHVAVLDKYDVNHDGVLDLIVACPIPFTNGAVLSYIDGNKASKMKDISDGGSTMRKCIRKECPEYKLALLDVNFIGMQIVSRNYNHWKGSARVNIGPDVTRPNNSSIYLWDNRDDGTKVRVGYIGN